MRQVLFSGFTRAITYVSLSLAIYIHSKTLWSKGEFCWFFILFSWKWMRCDGCLDFAKLSRVNIGMFDHCNLMAGVWFPEKLLNFCDFRFNSWILHLNARFTISFGCLWWLVFNGRWRRSGQVWQLIHSFLFLANVPMQTLSQRGKPIWNLILSTNGWNWIDGCSHVQAVTMYQLLSVTSIKRYPSGITAIRRYRYLQLYSSWYYNWPER